MAEAVSFFNRVMPGKVSQPHAKAEDQCFKCHRLLGKNFEPNCVDCHKAVREDLRLKRGFHGKTDVSGCVRCHTEHQGREAQLIVLEKEKFDHTQTEYLLTGKHLTVECEKCHQKPKYRETPKVCFSCHEKDDYHKKTLGQECERCHVPDNWKKIRFDHSKTDFPLLGKHETVTCDKCHKTGVQVKDTPQECYACHQKDDPHKQILGTKCESCHTAADWKKPTFDHGKTRYPLTGKHQAVECLKCHKDTRLKETPQVCVQCHKKDDPHKEILGTKCDTCHIPQDWKKSTFDHGKTEYPLLGKHQQTECQKCHKDTKLKETPTVCYQCHKKEDPHKGNLTACDQCHLPADWKKAKFDHSKTKYPLTGKHQEVECRKCHEGERYKGVPSECIACHKKEDVHKEKLGTTCAACHDPKTWKKAPLFDHQKTDFPIRGKHRPVKCGDCHKTQIFKDTSAVCYACHKKDDEHKGRFGTKCDKCHTDETFERKDFNHKKETGYALEGAHSSVKCLDCHLKPLYASKTPSACGICHRKDDIHDGELGIRCERCHRTTRFKDVRN